MWFDWDFSAANADDHSPAFYAFTGEQGRANVPVSEVADEYPETPGDAVGLPAGTTTGPNLLVYALGLGNTPGIAGATLKSAAGQSVPVRTVDGTTTYQGQTFMFSWHGDIIPVNPLSPGTEYTATVDWRAADGTPYVQTFSFTTAIADNDVSILVSHMGSRSRVTVETPAPNASLDLSGPRHLAPTLDARGGTTVDLSPGTWKACATSGGDGTGYRPAAACTSFTIYAPTRSLLAAHIQGNMVAISARGVLLDRSATVAFLYDAAPCPTRGPITSPICGEAILAGTAHTRLTHRARVSAPASPIFRG